MFAKNVYIKQSRSLKSCIIGISIYLPSYVSGKGMSPVLPSLLGFRYHLAMPPAECFSRVKGAECRYDVIEY